MSIYKYAVTMTGQKIKDVDSFTDQTVALDRAERFLNDFPDKAKVTIERVINTLQ